MKEVVLPVSGDFARLERVKFSELMICAAAPIMVLALIERLVTVEGCKVDCAKLDNMALADALVLVKLVNDELAPLNKARGVS